MCINMLYSRLRQAHGQPGTRHAFADRHGTGSKYIYVYIFFYTKQFIFVNVCVQHKKLSALLLLFAHGLHEEAQSSTFLWNMICKLSLLHNSIADI